MENMNCVIYSWDFPNQHMVLNADFSKAKYSSRNFNSNCYLFLSSQFSILTNNYTVPVNL